MTTTTADRARETIEAAYRARTRRSAALFEEARAVFPGGVTRSVTYHAPYPLTIARGCGARVDDVDGNEYLDHLGNFGSMIHGHAHPAIVAAMREQAGEGTDFGAPTELHLALAREIMRRVPSVERLRFTASGTEAVAYAVRAARAFTGRPAILKMEGSYHGGYDSVSVSVDPGASAPEWPRGMLGGSGLPPGVLEHTLVAPYNDLDRVTRILREHARELAAVIVEPVTVRGMIPGDREFLLGLERVARELGVLFILDEVVTFRLAPGGAQSALGLTPDLTTLGKVIGGGLPVGAFGGRADVMAAFDPSHARPVHHSGTFAGNSLVMAAGLAALALLTPSEIGRINALGERLRDAIRVRLAQAGIDGQVTGTGSLVGMHFTTNTVRDYRSALSGDREAMRWLHLALLARGVFARAGGSFFLSTPMDESIIDQTADTLAGALESVMPLVVRNRG